MMMLVITHTLKENGPCPYEQQAALLSGYRNNEFHQDFRQELSNVPCFRLADLWPLMTTTLRSPAQYQGQQRSPWTRSTGKRVQNEPNDGRSRLSFRQSELVGQSKISWCTPTNSKKESGRESFFGRREAGGRTGRPPMVPRVLFYDLTTHKRV